MCGISASINIQESVKIASNLLVEVEHRGRDATGLAWIEEGKLNVYKDCGQPSTFFGRKEVKRKLKTITATSIIGHCRAASTNLTHRGKKEEAHPFMSEDETFAVLHNGGVIGYSLMQPFLESLGHKYASGVDSECIVHILEELLKKYKRDDAILLLRGMVTGNVLIMFNDKTIYGFAGCAFFITKYHNGWLVSSELDSFKDISKTNNEDSILLFPEKEDDAAYVKWTFAEDKVTVEYIGKWQSVPLRNKEWFLWSENKIICDFCGVQNYVQRVDVKGQIYPVDKCIDCFKDGVNVLRKNKGKKKEEEIDNSADYAKGMLGYYNSIDFPGNQNGTAANHILTVGLCAICGNSKDSEDIVYCQECGRFFCMDCFHDHKCKGKTASFKSYKEIEMLQSLLPGVMMA